MTIQEAEPRQQEARANTRETRVLVTYVCPKGHRSRIHYHILTIPCSEWTCRCGHGAYPSHRKVISVASDNPSLASPTPGCAYYCDRRKEAVGP